MPSSVTDEATLTSVWAGVGKGVGAGEGSGVGRGVGAGGEFLLCTTPHDVDAHKVLANALSRLTPSSTHQPRSWSKAEAPSNISIMFVTLSTAQPPMSWLKAEAPANKYDMSVTPPVAHLEMWPYAASAAVASKSHTATAVLIVVSSATRGVNVGAGVTVGKPVVGAGVGVQVSPCSTPHDVDAHRVPENAS